MRDTDYLALLEEGWQVLDRIEAEMKRRGAKVNRTLWLKKAIGTIKNEGSPIFEAQIAAMEDECSAADAEAAPNGNFLK